MWSRNLTNHSRERCLAINSQCKTILNVFRAAKALAYFTQGYNETLDEILNEAIFTENTDEMVIVKNIQVRGHKL